MNTYESFIAAKAAAAPESGFAPVIPFSPTLFPHQRDVAAWALKRGCAAIFAAFGTGKTRMQLEIARQTEAHAAGRFLIIAPLGVRQEFQRDAAAMEIPLRVITRDADVADTDAGIFLAHYEPVRDGKLDPTRFVGVSLDEASCLRGFGSTKTFREFMARVAGDDRRDPSQRVLHAGVRYRFVATATPAPNDYIELLAYSAFLGVMEISVAKTKFFKRNSEKADDLTILPHREKDFWEWVSTWATFLTKPSDLGYSDEGYALPPLRVEWHELPTDHAARAKESRRDGQLALFASTSMGVSEAAREKRASLDARVAKLMEIRAADPTAHRVIWHDLEDERRAIEAAIPGITSVFGTQDITDRIDAIVAFAEGRVPEIAAKPVMLGSGVNFQRHCSEAVFLGIGFKFNDFIQAIHRLYRFQQTREVVIHLIYTEAEREVRAALEAKWRRHNELVDAMTAIVREHGLAHRGSYGAQRASVIDREEVVTERATLVHGDTVIETRGMADDSVDLIVTSIPFSTQYEYTPHLNDFGHTDTNAHFWEQMGFLIPELLRVLRPGRIAAIHVKDRIVPGGLAGVSFQTVYPFSDDTVRHFTAHGFAFLARKTIVTDVVRENAQTYRLGWTEQCKDGSRMGNGMPEYMLIFRKPPTSSESGYADVPVVKSKERYTRARWQFDAHGFTRSSGNRLLMPDDLVGLTHKEIFRLFRHDQLAHVYDHARVVAIAEACAAKGMLPSGFMLLQPQSWHPDVWTDVARMRTLNTTQATKGREAHVCPLQFDIVERCIEQYSMEGETVFDPFGGLMTVPYCAVRMGRRGRGHELNPGYFRDGVNYVRAAERDAAAPTLFDLVDLVAAQGEASGASGASEADNDVPDEVAAEGVADAPAATEGFNALEARRVIVDAIRNLPLPEVSR